MLGISTCSYPAVLILSRDIFRASLYDILGSSKPTCGFGASRFWSDPKSHKAPADVDKFFVELLFISTKYLVGFILLRSASLSALPSLEYQYSKSCNVSISDSPVCSLVNPSLMIITAGMKLSLTSHLSVTSSTFSPTPL